VTEHSVTPSAVLTKIGSVSNVENEISPPLPTILVPSLLSQAENIVEKIQRVRS
jgi:hypothetical protein